MIVIGVDSHKRRHTAAAVRASTGELVGAKTVAARDNGHGELVRWARSFGDVVVFAVEDCRQVSQTGSATRPATPTTPTMIRGSVR
jgi:hypothetical protein